MELRVRPITPAEHRAYAAAHPDLPLPQTPGWRTAAAGGRTEAIGWFDDNVLVGTGLVRLRSLPRLPLRSVAVLEAGPDIDWTARRGRPLARWLDPMVAALHDLGVVTVRLVPPVAAREWPAFDTAGSRSSAVVRHVPTEPAGAARSVSEQLQATGWLRLPQLGAQVHAEIPLRSSTARVPATGRWSVRSGNNDDLDALHATVRRRFPRAQLPAVGQWRARWEALRGADQAGASIVVVLRDGEVVHGGMLVVTGTRAWDLSPVLTGADADAPEADLLRSALLARAAAAGARSLEVATVNPARRAPLRLQAPGWPPVHLSEWIGTWQYPIRPAVHQLVAPLLDRLAL